MMRDIFNNQTKISLPISNPFDLKLNRVANKLTLRIILNKKRIALIIISKHIKIRIAQNKLVLSVTKDKTKYKALLKFYDKRIRNLMRGLIYGHYIRLKITGIGYKCVYHEKNKELELFLGFSHTIILKETKEIKLIYKNRYSFCIWGLDKKKTNETQKV